jgi:hypothetical protein
MKTNFILVILLLFLTFGFSYAQMGVLISPQDSPVLREAPMEQPTELWKPFKLNDGSNNVLNGVHIFHVKGECNAEKVALIKLVNTNPHPVKFSYQLSPQNPVVEVVVPASTNVEGSCSATDSDIKKLVIAVPAEKTGETKKNKEFLHSHISVSPL